MNPFLILAAAALLAPSAAENRRLEEELAQTTRRYAAEKECNNALLKEKRNFERALLQQQQLLLGGDGKIETAPPSPQIGEVVFLQKFDPPFRISGAASAFASVQTLPDEGGGVLVIDYPAVRENTNPVVLFYPDPAAVAGKKLKFSVWAKGIDLSRPERGHQGAVFSLRLKKADGSIAWPGKTLGGGSFDWKSITFTEEIPVGGSFAVMLGLQGVTGKVLFRDLKIETIL